MVDISDKIRTLVGITDAPEGEVEIDVTADGEVVEIEG